MLSAISTKILLGLAAISTVVLGFFSQSTNLGSTVPITPAIFETSLASPIGASDTSMTLSSATLLDGTTLSGYACFTLDSGQPNLEYVCGTASSTSITSMTRGINPLNGTSSVAALKYTHRRGANVKITDYPALSIIGRIVNGIDTFPTTVKYDSSVSNANIQADNRNLVNYGLLAATVIAGGIPASDSTAGIAKLSVAAASTTNPIVVGDNDTRVSPVSLATLTSGQIEALVGSSGTPSATNTYITNTDTSTSTSASRIVRYQSNGNINIPQTPGTTTDAVSKYYVDNLPKMQVFGSGTGDTMSVGFSQDGTQMFTTYFNANNQFSIVRWAKDPLTGQYYQVGDTVATIVGSAIFTSGTTVQGIAVIGSYVYVSMASYVYRFSNTNVAAGGTNLTISGTAPSGNPCAMYTDGTDLYINSGSGTTWYRYTISGTTITNAQTLTGPSGYNGAWSDGSKVYLYNGSILGRYAHSLGTVQATTSIITSTFGTTGYVRGVGYASASSTYLATANILTSSVILLNPVTKP